jgi:geranylgeranyl pyrophosphate synthase
MKPSALAFDDQGIFIEPLDREFAAPSLAELGDGAAKEVPWRLWSQALYAPLYDFLSRPGKEFRAELLTQCWSLGGRKDPPPPELALVVEALHAGSLIIDDIEDASLERRGRPALHHVTGLPTALNAGNWLYFWPFRLFERIETTLEIRAGAYRLMTNCLLECHYGQALDLSIRLPDLAQSEVAGVVRAIAELKTGSLMALAAGLGALASGAHENIVRAAIRFGRELGTALQMLDDLSGLVKEDRYAKGLEDIGHATPTWPWAWLSLELDEERFAALQAMAREVANGKSPSALLQKLGGLVAPLGKRRVHAFLEHAFVRFANAVPSGPGVAALRLELERLERSYV